MDAPRVRIADATLPALVLASCAALLFAPVAFAGKNLLYKCVDATGVISIQSVACPAGWTEAWKRDATPEPALTPEQRAQMEARKLRDEQNVREQLEIVDRKMRPVAPATEPVADPAAPAEGDAPAVAGEPAKEAGEPDACAAAQAFAGSVRDKTWLGLSEEQVRRLYSWVAEQCKAPSSPR
jgi:Spy/CpxP family protein refolding chaperone